MNPETFECGNVVYLKSGSLPMTYHRHASHYEDCEVLLFDQLINRVVTMEVNKECITKIIPSFDNPVIPKEEIRTYESLDDPFA